MARTKRTASDVDAADTTRTTRASKAAKTDGSSSPKSNKTPAKGGKKGIKASLPKSAFKSTALPLHVNITHTPPVITSDDATVPSASADPGFIGSTTLVPSVFATGSYGWKGSKRVAIEIPNPDGGENEKVQVMITINAAVIGSKQAKEGGDDEKKDADDAEPAADDAEADGDGEAAEPAAEEEK